MFDQMTPANWFWILMALLVTCGAKIMMETSPYRPEPVSPAAVFSWMK